MTPEMMAKHIHGEPKSVLAKFRRRIALTNKRAGWHYMAIERVLRGQDALDLSTGYRFASLAGEGEKVTGIGGRYAEWPIAKEYDRSRYILALNGRDIFNSSKYELKESFKNGR